MKKIPVILMASFMFSLTFTSCKKDYTCTCTENGATVGIVGIPDSKKGDAETLCSTTETNYNASGANANCTLD